MPTLMHSADYGERSLMKTRYKLDYLLSVKLFPHPITFVQRFIITNSQRDAKYLSITNQKRGLTKHTYQQQKSIKRADYENLHTLVNSSSSVIAENI